MWITITESDNYVRMQTYAGLPGSKAHTGHKGTHF